MRWQGTAPSSCIKQEQKQQPPLHCLALRPRARTTAHWCAACGHRCTLRVGCGTVAAVSRSVASLRRAAEGLPKACAQEDVHRQLVRKVDDPRSIDAAPDLPPKGAPGAAFAYGARAAAGGERRGAEGSGGEGQVCAEGWFGCGRRTLSLGKAKLTMNLQSKQRH
jgi:hypothetical protein